MTYKLGNRSKEKLEGIDERMASIVRYAISVTKQDFSVICGMRTRQEQEVLFKKGASKTMKSKHLEGNAVDLMAWIDGGRWELKLYDEIADAMAEGARAIDTAVKWGAAWSVGDIRYWDGTMEEAMNAYVDLRRSQGKRPFIDGPHFELMD
tara:strand:+ start:161 stop:613 length:453 start_codon:yes stop_codon:yes gene_type:complete